MINDGIYSDSQGLRKYNKAGTTTSFKEDLIPSTEQHQSEPDGLRDFRGGQACQGSLQGQSQGGQRGAGDAFSQASGPQQAGASVLEAPKG